MAFKDAKNENVSLILSSDAKPRLKWTTELHQRFIDAVNQLGGADRATPKSLMRIMGIHGLTLYHLKSHLQKYRIQKSQISLSSDQNEHEYKGNERNHMIEGIWEGDQKQPDGTLEISQALQIQMEVQRNLNEHIEVQKHLQLKIEAQGKYLQSVLQKAQDILHCPGSSLSLLTELERSLPMNGDKMQFVKYGWSLESSLTSSDNSENQ